MDGKSFVGKFELVSSTNFDEYMKRLGVSFATRKIAAALSPSIDIAIDNDLWTVKTMSSFKSEEAKFKLGDEVEMTALDGRRIKLTCELKDGKLVQTQKPVETSGKESVLIRELTDDGMITTCRCEDVECKRVYKRA